MAGSDHHTAWTPGIEDTAQPEDRKGLQFREKRKPIPVW